MPGPRVKRGDKILVKDRVTPGKWWKATVVDAKSRISFSVVAEGFSLNDHVGRAIIWRKTDTWRGVEYV